MALNPPSIPRRRIRIAPSWRIISTPRHKVTSLAVGERQQDAVERILARYHPYAHLVDKIEARLRVIAATPGSDVILAPFVWRSVSRFSRGDFGVYYASDDIQTAIEETKYHRTKLLRESRETPDARLPVTAFTATIEGRLHDIRSMRSELTEVYSPTDYAASQALGLSLFRSGSLGVAYASVRRESGQCFGMFLPTVLSDCVRRADLEYEWSATSKSIVAVRVVI